MKIFSQSTACALVAVANASPVIWADGHIPMANPLPTTDEALFIPINGGTTSCIGGGGSLPYCKYELYGGWDLPVPPPNKSELESGEPACYMGHLPRRGEMGKMERIDCFSNEMAAFRDGYGLTVFTGFVSWRHSYTYQRDMIMRDERCWLVANGKLTPILGHCRDAILAKPDRHVVEDLSDSNEIERFPHEFYY